MNNLYKVETADNAAFEKARKNGKISEFRVHSVLRGGWLYRGRFYFMAGQKRQVAVPMAGDGLAGLVILG